MNKENIKEIVKDINKQYPGMSQYLYLVWFEKSMFQGMHSEITQICTENIDTQQKNKYYISHE